MKYNIGHVFYHKQGDYKCITEILMLYGGEYIVITKWGAFSEVFKYSERILNNL